MFFVPLHLKAQLCRRQTFYKTATDAVEPEGSPFALADEDTDTQRGIRKNVPGLASRFCMLSETAIQGVHIVSYDTKYTE